MSKSWNEKEIKIASEQMQKMGHLSYEEFIKVLNKEEENEQRNRFKMGRR